MNKITKIGITGQSGFVGYHLYQTLKLQNDVELITCDRNLFEDDNLLKDFVKVCDVIVHLAALNRHEDGQVLYETNVTLVKKLINACVTTKSKPHILFSSSTQEVLDNFYGQSKKTGKELFDKWSQNGGGIFTSLIVPNVFGPFGKPNYNSVVSTFCYKVTRGEKCEIHKDGEIGLVYINELVADIIKAIKNPINSNQNYLDIKPRYFIKVSDLLNQLENYKSIYLEKGIFPSLESEFDKALFNTFRCYIPYDHYPVQFKKHTDIRGSFVEIARTETSGQFSFSTTKQGITRGNHFHTRKAERFAVIKGKARIELRKIGSKNTIQYYLDGEKPSYVDMPIWHTHNITNIGEEELVTLFWINEPYNSEDADTYFETV